MRAIPPTNFNDYKSFTKDYFDSLPPKDISKQYFQGLPYQSNFWQRSKMFFCMKYYVEQLSKFYPYTPMVSLTGTNYRNLEKTANVLSAVVSGFACLTLRSMAHHNIILPFLREYGKVLGTHRLLRHYIYALILPYLFFQVGMRRSYLNHVETMWGSHAKRLNNKNINEPKDTRYPIEMIQFTSPNMKEVWTELYVPDIARFHKTSQQLDVFQAEDFQLHPPHLEAVKFEITPIMKNAIQHFKETGQIISFENWDEFEINENNESVAEQYNINFIDDINNQLNEFIGELQDDAKAKQQEANKQKLSLQAQKKQDIHLDENEEKQEDSDEE